jgi:predicted RNase H-like HicB family nuclease
MDGAMKRTFTASVWREGDWYVAQCLEVDVASQGETKHDALKNLREALELHFEEPTPTSEAEIETIEVGRTLELDSQPTLDPFNELDHLYSTNTSATSRNVRGRYSSKLS